MKKSFKIPFLVVSIIALVLFLATGAMYVVHILSVAKEFSDVTFASIFTKYLVKALMFDSTVVQLAGSIALYASVVIGIALIVLSCVLIKKQPLAKTFSIIASALVIVLGVAIAPLLVAVPNPGDHYILFFASSLAENKALVISSYALVSLAGLYLVASVVLLAICIVYSKKNLPVKEGLVENEAVVPEDVSSEPVEAAEAPSDPVEYDDLSAEPVPVFTPEPEPEPEPAPAEEPLSQKELAAMIRDIVRDEIARNNASQQKPEATPTTDNHSIVGATFGGPLIVQYFGSGVAPVQQQAVEPAPAPAPVKEPEPAPAPVVKEEVAPVPAPAPVVEVPVVEEAPKAPIVRIPFQERMIKAEKEMQDHYNEIKNEILSYGVKSRVSSSGDTFRLHRKTYVKLTIAGKSLKLYFALNPDDYKDSTIPVQDASDKAAYAEIPLIFKVKSELSLKRVKQLIQTVMESDNLEQGEIGTVNWVKEIKAEMKEQAKSGKKEEKEED